MKARFIPLALTTLLAVTQPARAQLVVTDPQALFEAIKQVKAWDQQYRQMSDQIKSMTGDRGMSRLLPQTIAVLPPDWNASMTTLSSLAQEIRRTQAVLTPAQAANLDPAMQGYLAKAQDLSAASQAMAQNAYNDAAARQSRLQKLTDTLATTNDPKAAYDLANAIAIEHAALQKDQNQLAAAANGTAAQAEAQRLMIDQMRAAAGGSGNFPVLDTSLP